MPNYSDCHDRHYKDYDTMKRARNYVFGAAEISWIHVTTASRCKMALRENRSDEEGVVVNRCSLTQENYCVVA